MIRVGEVSVTLFCIHTEEKPSGGNTSNIDGFGKAASTNPGEKQVGKD